MADDDPRDERLGAWLEVAPLDEVTRRRLVSTAVAAATADRRTPSHAARWIAAAAAIVVSLVVGLALLTAHGGHDEQRASTPTDTPAPSEQSGAAPAPAAGAADSAQPEATAAPPVEVGDFGDLSVAANLTRLRAALESASAPGASASGARPGKLRARGVAVPAATPQRHRHRRGHRHARRPARGRGAHHAARRQPLGRRAARGAPCEVRPLS